jgi:hypothetical protein
MIDAEILVLLHFLNESMMMARIYQLEIYLCMSIRSN